MTVRFKIALAIFITGALTGLGVIATVPVAFQRFAHETTYYRADAFLERVVGMYPDIFDLHSRRPDDFEAFLRSLVLFAQWDTLRRLDHFRREGVSNLSHDLRSPLTATTACLETLAARWASNASRENDRRLIEVARRYTRNAARLVQSAGDLA